MAKDNGSSKEWHFFAKSFLAGGLAGMTSKTTVAPLDRIKILLQVHNKHYKNFGVFTGLYAIVKQESFLSLYKGNGAQMVRIFPYAAIQFMSFEGYKRALDKLFHQHSSSSSSTTKPAAINHELKFIAGSAAGVTSVLMTYPLDLVRARLASVVMPKASVALNVVGVNGGTVAATAASSATSSNVPTTIVGTLLHVFRHEGGVRGLYRGITPTVLAMIPYGGCNFYMFERLKHWAVHYGPGLFCTSSSSLMGVGGGNGSGQEKRNLNVPAKLLCGGAAGAIGQTVIYPLDVARRRMQLSMASQETSQYSSNFMRALWLTYQNHGISKGLYRGMSVNYVRAIPMVAVSFCTYELLKQMLGLETGV